MSHLLLALCLPHITVSGYFLYMLIKEQRMAEREQKDQHDRYLQKLQKYCKKSASRRYLASVLMETSPMRAVARNERYNMRNIQLRRWSQLLDKRANKSFNINSPLLLFTKDNKVELRSQSFVFQYENLLRKVKTIANINTIKDELIKRLSHFRERRVAYNKCLDRIPVQANIITSPLARLVRKTHDIAAMKTDVIASNRRRELNSPSRKFARSNKFSIDMATQRRGLKTLTYLCSPLHRTHCEISTYAQKFLADIEAKKAQKEIFNSVLKDLIENSYVRMNKVDRNQFRITHKIPDIDVLPTSKTVFRMIFPEDKVYCYSFLAEFNLEGFEAHVEYLGPNRFYNYCEATLTGMTSDEIIDFVRNISHDHIVVESDTISQARLMSLVCVTPVITYYFTHKEAISTKAFEKYQKQAAEYGAMVTFPKKFNDNMIKVTFANKRDVAAANAFEQELLKKFKGLRQTGRSVMLRWVDEFPTTSC